jgi:hypothetical protein
MKNLLLIVGILFVFGAVSCKKDYTCTCTILGIESKSEIKDAKKSDAEDACSALETAAKITDASASCSI